MHFTKLAYARSSKAYSAWHTGQGCLNDCFRFAMQGLLQVLECFFFFFFFEKREKFNRQKDFKEEHCFVQNFNMSDSKGSQKRKGMFLAYKLYFKRAFESFLSFVLL